MRKILFNLLVLTLLCGSNVMAQFSGAGTESDPYLLSSDQDLQYLANSVNAGTSFSGKFFLQTADINLVESQIFSDGFTPIGGFDGNRPFSGSYDGGGHSISKMVINGVGKLAMFSNLQNGCIKNLNLENVNFSANGASNISGLVAVAGNSTISNVTVSGQLSAYGEMPELYFAGMVGQATRTSVSGSLCMLTVDVENAQFNSSEVAGIAKGDSYTTVTDCFVSTFIRGNCSSYYPIVDNGKATRCLVAESNVVPSELAAIYNNCYFDHQNTILAEYPIQQTFTSGFVAKTTAELTSGSIFGNANWIETAGLYPRPASVASTNAAILAAAPVTLNSADCIASVGTDFTVSTANGVAWDTESSYLQVSGNNVSLLAHPDSLVEIYAYRSNLVKNLGVFVLGDRPGTKVNPYRISTEEDLWALSSGDYSDLQDYPYFLVDSDIVINSAWTPIEHFSGHFDGGNHTITFTYGLDDYSYMGGFFSVISNATVCNLNLVCNIIINGYGYAGGLATYAESSLIYNCTVSGSIFNSFSPEDMGYCGGVVASAYNTTFYKCVNMADIEVQTGQVGVNTGGIVGDGENLIIRSCTNLGKIWGYPDQGSVGGIIGNADSVTIVSCANYVSISCEGSVPGGIAGYINNSTVTDCANYGNNPLAEMSVETNFTNNIVILVNLDSFSDTSKTEVTFNHLIIPNGVGGGDAGYYQNGTFYAENNYTDKQIIPIAGGSSSFVPMLTSELISGTELDADKWILGGGRYPIPVETVTDHDLVKLATTPFVLGATDSENYETIETVCSDITLGATSGISWMVDSVPVTGNVLDVDAIRLDSRKVTKTLSVHIGDSLSREYVITISPRAGAHDNPLLIESLSDFNAFADAIGDTTITYRGVTLSEGGKGLYFKLTADIEAQQGSTNVVRVQRVNNFSGNFNGGGHTITVTSDDIVGSSSCGLFTSILFAKIDSLNVVVSGDVIASNLSETSGNYIAILCSQATSSIISNCTVTLDGTFTGSNGALVCGLLRESKLVNCTTLGSGSISLGGARASGIVNYSQNSRITNCTNNVNINAQSSSTVSGGIAAMAYSLILENCTNNADIINANSGYYLYSAGIVGMLEGDGSHNLNNIIRNAVNNGRVEMISEYNNDGVAAGIVAGYNTSSGHHASVNVEKCVNAGYVKGGDGASGIAYQIEGEVSNCANYGIIESTGDVAGINCVGDNSRSVGNIEVGMVINEYNYDGDYTENIISPDADEDDFFDEQITGVRVDSLKLNFNRGGTPCTTRQMVGSALADDLPGDWDFAENLYPLPAGLNPNDPRNKLARMPIILRSEGLNRCENMSVVISDFTLPQVDGVTWESSSPDIVSAPSGGGVATVTHPQTDSTVTITAICEGISKTYTIYVHSATGVSADNPIIISNDTAFFKISDAESYPSGGYGLYFRLGNSIEITGNPHQYIFTGSFDGGGYAVKWANGKTRQLFESTEGAEISNLLAYGGNVALIGDANATTIRSCALYTDISGAENASGLVRESSDGTLIDGCIVVGNIVAKHSGGFVANAKDTRIANSISMISGRNNDGAEQEDIAAFVLSGSNVVVDSCLVIGSYLQNVSSSICPGIGNEGSSIYYDKQQWNLSDDNSLSAIGMTTRELVGDGIFADSAKWVHSEGKYPVPAGTEDFLLAKLVSTPMLIGANDRNVMELTSLGISAEQVEGEVQWSANSDSGITADLTVSCVDSPRSAEIVATLTDSITYTFVRPVQVTKGIVTDDYTYSPALCEGVDLIMPVPNYGEATYQWSVEPEMQIDEIGTDSIAVRIPSDFFASRALSDSLVNLTLTITFDGCEKIQNFEFYVQPSPNHIRLNDTALCVGSEIMLSCYADEGYEEYIDRFYYQWFDSEYDENTVLGEGSNYYIPSINADRNVTVVVGGCIAVSIPIVVSAIEAAPITVVSGEPNQRICEGELMEPIVFSVTNPTYSLPDRMYAEYDTANNRLTLSGRPFESDRELLTYNIFACGNNFNGTIDVSRIIMIGTDESFSQVINLGENVNIRFDGYIGIENLLTWESVDGTETFTTEDLGLYVRDIDSVDFLQGTPEMPGEYIFRITVPVNGACPEVVYDNFLGVYDNSELEATALDATLCIGETATIATVERPGAYGGEYVWTLEGDTVGTGSRINVIPPVGTSTYEVACGGKRMYGEFEVGDNIYADEAFGETGYSMRKYFEYNQFNTTGYLIANVEQDSLLLMSLSKIEEVEWSQAPEMLASDDADLYLPSVGELGYVLDNYEKFYFLLDGVILTSTENDANAVYALNTEYGLMMEHPKTEPAVAMGFKKIAKSEVINMVGRTSNISRTGSVDITVSDRHEMSVSTDDVLCNTDTAHVAIETEYPIVNWYNAISSDEQVVVENGTAVLTEGSYIAIGTDEYGSCHDTLEVKVKDLAFYMPQDTTVCDSAVLTIAKEDVTVMLGDEVIDGQTITITESGIYDIILIGIGDTCREEKTINVTVNQSYSISFDTIVLDSEFVWNGETYSATSDYEQRFTSVVGCDSVVTVHLTIVNTETEFAVYGNVTEGDGVSQLSGVNVVSGGASTVTDEAGYYVIMVSRANPILQFAKAGYNFVCDTIAESGQHNVVMLKPEMSVSLSDDSYETNPYVMRQFTVQLSNTGDGPMAWSSLVETAQTRNVPHRRNSTTMWEYADTVIRTNNNAEQAIATDGYYIYTASWQRAGEFSRYSIDNGYLETFIIEGVGGIRNMTYGNGFFFATDNTNKIYKINMDSQRLEDVITLNDPDLQIRYCAYSTAEDLLYIGNWTNLYKLVAYNTAYPTLIPLSYTMDNVYSVAYDEFSGATPCLWAFSQVSENNGPFAKIYKLNTNGIQVEGMVHYINDASLASPSSLAGGICVSQYLYDDRFVLLANVQNTNATNNIAVYELGRKNSWVSTDVKGGVIPVGGSIDVTVTEYAVENGNYTANVKFKPVVCMPEVMEVGLSMAVSTPQCAPVANLVAETDTFHTINLSWDAAERGDYESVSYLLYEEGTAMPIDTIETNSYTISNPEVGNHCYYVRAFMRGEADCVSEASNTACAEIEEFPCNVQLSLTARAYGDRIKLEWNALYGAESYAVFTADLGGEGLYIGSETTFVDTLALPETDYCYKVVAYFANGECQSIESNDACARIASVGCSELPVVTAKAVGNSVAVSWTRVGDVQSYSLYRDGKYLTSTADTIFYDMMLDFETEYCYVVEIDCGYGNYGLSETACATTDAEVIEENGIELLNADSFELYPNPAAEMFFIEGQQMQGIQILNFAGQVVYELDNISDDRLSIDASGFAPGVYAVRIILSDSRSVVKRIVIVEG